MQLIAFLGRNKQLLTLFGVIILLLAYGIGIALRNNARHIQPTHLVYPSPVVSQSMPDVTYAVVSPTEKDTQAKLLDLIQNRRPLTDADKAAKQNILAMLPKGESSGILYESGAVSIEYVHSADLFQVAILTKDIAAAKKEAATWFKSKGFSDEGICHSPVSFYLNYQIAHDINKQNNPFNPLLPGC